MPHLSEMTGRGVMEISPSSLPMVCPTLWSSIATGVFGNHHQILTPVEPDGRGDVRPVQSTSRRRKAIWNILSQNGLRSAVVGWPATHPAEPIDGVIVTDRYPHTSGPARRIMAGRPAHDSPTRIVRQSHGAARAPGAVERRPTRVVYPAARQNRYHRRQTRRCHRDSSRSNRLRSESHHMDRSKCEMGSFGRLLRDARWFVSRFS